MKKHRCASGKNRYILSLAALLVGCILWSGCGMEENRSADTEQIVESVAAEGADRGQIEEGAAAGADMGQIEEGAAAGADTGQIEEGAATEGADRGQVSAVPEKADEEEASPLLEQLFSYEVNKNFGKPYLTITGIAEEYRDSFWENMDSITLHSDWHGCMLIPTDINGMPVKVVGEEAFAGMDIKWLNLPDTLVTIGDGAFRNTNVTRMDLPENLEYIGTEAFAGCGMERLQFPDGLLTIGERAFAGSRDLWTVLIPNVQTIVGDRAFADCREGFLLCYGDDPAGRENLVAEYAEKQGLDSMEIILSSKPIVNYPDEPLVLKPEIGSFFYGDYEDGDEELWCSWEEDENAPNFGYIDWQAPGCSSWCGAYGFERDVEASSELASANGRYAAGNALLQDRRGTWAEGAEGFGIGESLTYHQSCTYGIDNKWEAITYDHREPELDGFMRYSEICIVNGYAKTRQTWEENGRIKKLLLYVENRPYAYLELEDTIQPQYFKLPEDDIKVINGGMLEARFEIVEVYPGSKYEDTCLTGLIMEFTGRYAH